MVEGASYLRVRQFLKTRQEFGDDVQNNGYLGVCVAYGTMKVDQAGQEDNQIQARCR